MLVNADAIRNKYDILHQYYADKYGVDREIIQYLRTVFSQKRFTKDSLIEYLQKKIKRQGGYIKALDKLQKKEADPITYNVRNEKRVSVLKSQTLRSKILIFLQGATFEILTDVLTPSDISKERIRATGITDSYVVLGKKKNSQQKRPTVGT